MPKLKAFTVIMESVFSVEAEDEDAAIEIALGLASDSAEVRDTTEFLAEIAAMMKEDAPDA